MDFKNLFESAVGKVGRTSMIDAEAYVTDELRVEFKKIVKKMGGKAVATQLLKTMNYSGTVVEAKKDADDIESDVEEAGVSAISNVKNDFNLDNKEVKSLLKYLTNYFKK